MKEKILEKRYAEAFLSFAKESVGIEKAVEELKDIKIIICGNPEMEEFLYNLEITHAEKREFIDKVFMGVFSNETRHFLKFLLEKKRIEHLIGICDYVRVKYSHGEALEVLLRTSYPLELELIRKIKIKLGEKFRKKINLFLELDPNLLGGIQVRIGNTIIDGSVRRRLEELKEKLMTLQVS